jgi:uncharacterized membrane protein
MCRAAIIAAAYVVLSYLSSVLGIASGVIQFRMSEALCTLPFFTAAAIPGVTLGCLLTNILFGGNIFDVILGTLATFLGCIVTYALRNSSKFLAAIPPIFFNVLIIPFVLSYAYKAEDAIWFMQTTIFLGEFVTAGILGTSLIFALEKRKKYLF